MLAKKSYTVRPIAPELVDADLGAYHPLIRKLLHHRGVSTAENARHFLSPDYGAHTHDPFLLKDMEKVVSRIFQAIDANETIIIFSDYDADGIPGAVAFHDFFVKIGYENFENYIPHRHNEGFGLNIESLKSFAKNGAKLVISIDCGIANIKEAAIAKKLGLDLISPICLLVAIAKPGVGFSSEQLKSFPIKEKEILETLLEEVGLSVH